MHVCFSCVSFTVLSQVIGLEERVQIGPFCVRLGRKILIYSMCSMWCKT